MAEAVAYRFPAVASTGLENDAAQRLTVCAGGFSAAQGQGFEAGGHGVLKGGSAWMPDNKINGVDFILPFRFHNGAWQLGTRGPVSLRIAGIVNQVTAKNITADLQGGYPWSESNPLLLSDVSVDVLGGQIIMKQLRMPQHDPALLRVQNISSSELISAINQSNSPCLVRSAARCRCG